MLAINVAAFSVVIISDGDFSTFRNLLSSMSIKDGLLGLTAPIAAFILDGLLSADAKARIVYCRYRHPLPGSRAFSVHLLNEARADLDGFNALLNEFRVHNFWDSGTRKNKPDFSGDGGYKEEDRDRYAKVIAGGEPGTRCIRVQAGARFKYENEDDGDEGVGDSLHILAPNQDLIDEGKQDTRLQRCLICCTVPRCDR